jgi:hypothetical protein
MLMKDFRIGQHFEHEIAIAAMAVALEKRSTAFAEEFLVDLAKLRLAEMPLCIRVARECVKHRMAMTQNICKTFSPWQYPSSRNCQPTFELNFSPILSSSTPIVCKYFDMRSCYAKA